MPSLNGGTDEETYRLFQEHLVNHPKFDSESEALEYCVKSVLRNNFGEDV